MTVTSFLLIAAVVAVAVPVVVRQIRRARAVAHIVRHEVGPDAMRLLHDLDVHLDDFVANDPELAAGFDRLRAAIRDEQQKGDEA